ncbi:MAG TPA: hypothetical protein VJX47_14370 [Candidatus Sulfotelmatobacter sp.]|nr:hypothetical protein [Candidatus Sulfotelmatobacter sp.]
MKIKLDRIVSIATLVASCVAIVLVLKKPAPVAQPQTPAAIAANAQSFGQKMEQFEQATQQPAPASGVSYQPAPVQNQPATSSNQPKAEVHLNSDEVGAALAQAVGAAGASGAGAGELSPDSSLGGGEPNIKDQRVSFEGDTVHGQFLTEIAGKDVWVTVSGHLSSKDGYATFEPTEFKVGDLNVPVSLVNPALQKKLFEQRDRMKLPENVGDLKVQNGELVMQQK